MQRLFAFLLLLAAPALADEPTDKALLKNEVRDKGWIVFASKGKVSWDLIACRPDGSDRREVIATPDWHEIDPQWSRDGSKLLYRRVSAKEKIDQNNHGRQGELVIADADGKNAVVLGGDGEFPWASWSPDGKEIACLTQKGILFVDVATKKTTKTLPRKGFFQQMTWSPDGKYLLGVSNGLGTAWAIGRMNIATGEVNAVSKVDCCTPDWSSDGKTVVYSHRPVELKDANGQDWTQLWMADPDGNHRQLIFAKEKQHIYGGMLSPDGKYILFTGNINEDGDPGNAGSMLRLMRIADAPTIGDNSPAFLRAHPEAKNGIILELQDRAWEPCWTDKDVFK